MNKLMRWPKLKNSISFWTAMSMIVLFYSCIDQIEFDTNSEEPLIVIDGVFTNQDEMQMIRISQSIDVNSQIPIYVSGAEVYVEDEQGNRITFDYQTESKSYVASAKAEYGKSYRLFSILPDGREITSNYQTVPDTFPIGEISVVDTLANFADDSGNEQQFRVLDFYATATASNLEKTQYVRLSPKTVYQTSETKCGPFHTPKTCYFYNDNPPIDVRIFKIDPSTESVSYNSLVYRRYLDYSFGEVFALDLRLYTYNKEEYTYWERLKSIFDQDGGITDNTPGRLFGNIKSNDGTEIQGQFAVVGKTRKIKFVRNSDFSTQQLPLCGIPGARPFPLPDACCACDVLPKASLEKPSFWP